MFWGLGTVLSKYALGGIDASLLLPFQLACSVLLLGAFLLVTRSSLLALAEHDPEVNVRNCATWTLLDFDPEVVAPVARRGLEDSDADVRWTASFVLFEFGLKESLDEYPDDT